MFVRVFRDDIIEGLQKSASIIPAKTGAAFLRTIWLKAEDGALKIMATDSNLEFCGSYKAEIVQEGLAGVQGRAFYDLMRKLPSGQITIRTDEATKNAIIEQGSRKYKLPVNDPSWFQKFSDYPESGGVFWSGDFLQELIDRVAFCISDEDTMEAIACMNMVSKDVEGEKVVEVCGLNGHQFAMVRFVNDDIAGLLPENGILVQKKYVSELKKWLTADEIELAINDKRLFCRTGDRRETFSLPLSYYQYPDYQGFLAKVQGNGASSLSFARTEMIESLDRIMIFNSETNRCVNFVFNGQELTLFSQGQDVGQASESIQVDFSGELEKIAFPTRNLIEILGHYSSERVSFTLTGSEGPCGIRSEQDKDYLVIIMPMKIVEETYFKEEND
ncbi:DNA polymerase III, beta subunit [Desulfocurvibacter africanus PCS]|uniref:Beta sliding clamp n=1 Tax=Desulfocurvibacter africanus PCS TaxID=1262666 RepID=M5Q269_DESAF|nr:DNA polymerase III subunit beta [Desulfocurvibacter africanus]EMG38191.1 DNA polymerase III, beta subunit [Desulfocurvibacter africanus PCS]